ncbi:MAG: GTP 3',8-cyclase MoaA [Pirellulaceae bacterium]|jgi:cyclic pyranopterin phosphate synthase|nr:GTP 3',8-cyclase MoaA [Pirellulaceae bacterium]MDP7020650.1 GTP 3',8-cyclase MoaA [Pirellulaceae bacterium]
MPLSGPLVDAFGRVHTNLRISVTDRCNIRCFYCMPEENVLFSPRNEILTFEEIARFVRVAADMGVNKLRITGGEPLVRAQLPELIKQLKSVNGIDDVALTTNAILLADHAQSLRDAGLDRLNISIDTLSPEVFHRITRRDGLQRVLDGIEAARCAGFTRTRLNAVAIRGVTESEIEPLGRFARRSNLELRFIEFMPLDADGQWQSEHVLPGEEIRRRLEHCFGALRPAPRPDPSQPAVDYAYADGGGAVGFINPVSEPFCSACNRLRITAEGQVRNCLFSTAEWDARSLLRGGGSDEQLARLTLKCVAAKKPAHGIDQPDFVRPERAMYQIGG